MRFAAILPLILLSLLLLAFLRTPIPAAPLADAAALGEELEAAAGAGNLAEARRLIRELGASGEAAATAWVLRSMTAFDDAEIAGDVIDALRALGVDRIGEACEAELAREKSPPIIRAVILAAVEGFDDERSERWLVEALAAKDDMVLRNAIDSLVRRRSKAGIPALIDLLDRLGGKRTTSRYAVIDALLALTGHEFETVEDWRKFWAAQGASFDPNELDTEGRTGVARKRATPRESEFFGVEVVSQRVMFVIDTSGSMVLYDEGGAEEGGSGADWRVRQRINRVRQQLKTAIAKLPAGSRFNIISFDDEVHRFSEKGIVPADANWKKKGQQFADRLIAAGATHTDEAMRAAFRDKEIDTIILLSDGAPAYRPARHNLIPEILDEVRRMNRIRKVKIYTFGFDGPGSAPPNSRQDPNRNPEPLIEFLKTLASENGGTYTSIR